MSSDARRSSVYSTAARKSNAHTHRRSRSQSVSAVRDNVNDVRRHVNSVAQNSQALAEKFMDHLKKYKTFAPIFATDGVYSQGLFPALVPASHAIDQILDARASFLVRNTTHHRLVKPARSSGSPLKPEPSAAERLQHLEDGVDNIIQSFARPLDMQLTPRPPHGDSLLSPGLAGSLDPIESDSAYRLWKWEHPSATADEKNAEKRRRQNEILAAERAARAKYLRKWHAELELAQDEDRAFSSPAATLDATSESKAALAPRPPKRRVSTYDVEMQQLAWDVFQKGHQSTDSTNDLILRRQSLNAVIGDAAATAQLHRWVEGEWQHHTHRHEAAALKVQCAFRCHRAKRIVMRARYLREQDHQETLRSEEEAMFAWKVAVELTREERDAPHKQSNSDDPDAIKQTLQSVNFFVRSVNAKVLRRRIERQRTESEAFELQTFAAIRIQAVYRGHRGRQLVNELRHPEIGQRRLAAIHAASVLIIQRVWKGHHVRSRQKQRCCAAVRLQCWFRSVVAAQRLSSLRRQAHRASQYAVETFASNRIKRFLRRSIGLRRKRFADSMPLFQILYPVANGYLVRKQIALWHWERLARYCTMIQKVVRGFLCRGAVRAAREQANAAEEQRQRTEAAIVLQRNIRGHVSRQQTKRHTQRSVAALRIQAVYRGFRGRRVARAHRTERIAARDRLRVTDAAALIQAFYRGCQDRLYVASLRAAKATRPTMIRSRGARSALANTSPQSTSMDSSVTQDAALMIQDFYFRRVRMTKLLHCLTCAALRVVRFMRLATAKSESRTRLRESRQRGREAAAVSIQQAVRAYLAKSLTDALRAQRSQRHSELQRNEASIVITCFMRHCVTKMRLHRQRMQEPRM